MKRGWQWPIGIVGIMTLFVGASVYMAVKASDDPSFAVEPDYYSKAMHWDAELAQQQRNALLRWQLKPTLVLGTESSGGELSVSLADSTGAPISGARVSVIAMHNARASHELTATLHEVSGIYETALDARRPGVWELRFIVQHGADRFSASERVDALPRVED